MATIDKHPRSRFYRARYVGPDGKRICRSLKTTDRTVAMKKAADFELAAREGRAGTLTLERGRAILNEILAVSGLTPLDTVSTRAFAAGWLRDKESTKAAATGKRYSHVVREFLKSLGPLAEKPLAAIQPRHVEAFRDVLSGRGRAPASLRLDVKIISGIFAKAVRQGLLAVNPCGSVELNEATGQTREPFTAAEVKKLLRKASRDWKTVIQLGAFAGLRLGDAVNLTWQAVDLKAGMLTVTPQKTSRKGRVLTIPLHPTLASHLKAKAGAKAGLLAPSLAGRTTGGKTGLSRQFIELMEAAGISRASTKATDKQSRAVSGKSFHSLRHFFNSALLAAGVDEKTRMDLSGHTTATMNRKYSHSELDTLRAAIGKI